MFARTALDTYRSVKQKPGHVMTLSYYRLANGIAYLRISKHFVIKEMIALFDEGASYLSQTMQFHYRPHYDACEEDEKNNPPD